MLETLLVSVLCMVFIGVLAYASWFMANWVIDSAIKKAEQDSKDKAEAKAMLFILSQPGGPEFLYSKRALHKPGVNLTKIK